MAADFDPYHKWLGISPDERLPTHYRLLGLIAFESDPEVIEAAADRVMSYLQEVSTGAEMARAQKLLSEVSRARICLLNAEQKAAYDEKLREQLAALEADEKLRSRLPSQQPDEKLRSKQVSAQPADLELRPLQKSEDDLFDELLPLKSKDESLDQPPPQEPDLPSRRPLVLVCVGILILLFGGGLLGWLLSGQSGDPEIPTADQRAFANRTDRSVPAILPPSRGTKHATGTAKKTNLTKNKQPQATTTNSNNTKESESSTRDAVEKAPPIKKKKPQDKGSPAGSNGPSSFQIYPLTVDPNDNKSSLLTYPKQADGFHRVDAGTSTAKYYRLTATAPVDGITGFWIQFKSNAAAGDVLQQQAVLNNLEVRLAGNKIDWMAARSSAAEQQQGVERAIDPKPGSGWTINLDSNKDVWAVFVTKKSFHGETPLDVEIEFQHKDKMLRIPQFRISVITGNGTVEEMTQAVRDRVRAEKPFADFLSHGLPAERTGEVGLGSLFLGKEKLAAQLFGGNSNPDGARFSLEQITPAEEAAPQRWQFILSGAEQTPVAELTLKQNKLSLGWLPAAAQLPESASLQNGLLQLHIGEHVRSVPLREVKEQAPLTYNPLKVVKPQIALPAGVPAADLRLVLQFPAQTFGVNKRLVLSLAGDEKEQEVSLRDGIILKLVTSWKAPSIILKIKTLLRTGIEDKNGKKKMKDVPLKKAFTEIPELNARIKKGEKIIETIEAAEEHAHRKRPTTAQKQEMAKITRQWRALGIPQGDFSTEQMEKLRGVYEAKQEKIKNRRDRLQFLQSWAEQMGDTEAIEFRLYTLVDGMPLDLVRSTGWVGD